MFTHSPELDASTHFELHGAAHDVDALVPADDGFAVSFDVQVGRSVAGDLKGRKIQKCFILIFASVMLLIVSTHPLCGGLLDAEDFDSFGQVELVVLEVGAEEGGLCARVGEGNPYVAHHRGLVLLYAQLRGALLEHNLKKRKKTYYFGQILVSMSSFSVIYLVLKAILFNLKVFPLKL